MFIELNWNFVIFFLLPICFVSYLLFCVMMMQNVLILGASCDYYDYDSNPKQFNGLTNV